MKKRTTDNDTCACEQGHSKPSSRFLGTHNKRHLRVLAALLVRRLFREELDKIAGCSNSGETHRIGRYVLMTKPQEVTP